LRDARLSSSGLRHADGYAYAHHQPCSEFPPYSTAMAKTTTRYAHVLDEEVAAAMELLQNAAAKSRKKSPN
jgi:hypothetical protein